MSLDFSQDAQDHAHLSVYVTPLGDMSGALFGAVVDSLQDFPPIHPRGSKDSLIFVRFLNRLPRWAKDGQPWQEFQPHKQILGVLAVTQCHDEDDLGVAERALKASCQPFSATLCDSKCVVYGSRAVLGKAIHARKGFILVDFDNQQSFSKSDVEINIPGLEKVVTDFAETLYVKLQARITDKRKGLETGKLRVLRSPMDGREVEAEDDMRLTRNQLSGRHHKHLADLYLMCGQLQLACTYFMEAITQLSRDFLWAGSANEGLGATFIVKSRRDDLLGQKTPPLSVQSNLFGVFLKVPVRLGLKSTHMDLSRRRSGPAEVGVGGGGGGGGVEERGEGITNGRTSLYRRPKSPSAENCGDTSMDSIEDDSIELSGLMEAGEAGEGGEEQDGDDEEMDLGTRKLLQKDLVVDRFTRADLSYKKAGTSGGVPRIELLFKFAKYLVSQERNKSATDILQKVFWTEGYIDSQDKITLYESIAKVFTSMGYNRKAALFTHWAALSAFKIANSTQDHYKAHTLLSQCLLGYKLTTSPNAVAKVTPANTEGWPLLQAKMMLDLVYLSHKTDQAGMLIQHGCALLQKLHPYVDNADLRRIVDYLETITQEQQPPQPEPQNKKESSQYQTKKNSASPQRRLSRNLSSDSMKSLLPLTEFPRTCSFRPKQFPPHLRPYKTEGSTTKGPFIVSQLHRGKKLLRPEILWVINDPAEIAMDVTNPLDFELRVENMKLLSEGASVYACPSSLSLPAQDKQDFTLSALPQEVGELELIGYEHTVFGVHSRCRVKVEGNPLIKVIPSLPQLRLRVLPLFPAPRSGTGGDASSVEGSPLKRGESHRSSVGPKVELELIDGESCRVEFKVECIRPISIDTLSVTMESSTENHKAKDFCQFISPVANDINSLLPITKREQRSFFATINAKFPTYYRIKNDVVSRLSQRHSYGERYTFPTYDESSLVSQKQSFRKRAGPNRLSSRRRSQEGNFPPNVSPVAKRAQGKTESANRKLMMMIKQRQLVDSTSGPLATPNLMDSLNIDIPKVSNLALAASPPSSSSSLLHGISPVLGKRNFSTLGRIGSPKTRWQGIMEDEWDFNQYSNKRASIRSDPGERKRDATGFFNRSPRSSEISTPVHKSPSMASRTGGSFDDPVEDSPPRTEGEGAIFTFDDRTGSPRESVGAIVPPKSPLKTPLRKGAGGITKGKISQPSDLRHNMANILPDEVIVKGDFTLKYSGGEGGKAGYYRRMESSVKVKVRPCLYFDKFNISSVEGRQGYFALSFTVHNISGHSLTVTGSAKQGEEDVPQLYKMTLRSKQKEKMEILLRRFSLPESPVLQARNELNAAKLYCDHLAKMVTVRWELEGQRRNGVGTLEGMRLPSSVLNILQPVPVLMDLMVEGKLFAMDSELSEEYCVGSPVNIHLTLTSNAGSTVPPSWLLLDLCEFFGQHITRDLTGKMVHSGNLLQRVPQLEVGERYEHRVSLVFFYRGDYQLEFKLYIPSPDTDANTAGPKHKNSPEAIKRAGNLSGKDTTDGEAPQEYIADSLQSPILRSIASPPPTRSLSDLNCSGGSIFSPVKIDPRPLKSQLLPTIAPTPPPVGVDTDTVTSKPPPLPPTHRDGRLSITEASRLDREENKMEAKPSTGSLGGKLHWLPEIPLPVTLPDKRMRTATFTNRSKMESLHTKLSRLSGQAAIAGPVISLQIVDS